MDDQAADAGRNRAPLRGIGYLDLAEGGAQVEGGGGKACGIERGVGEPRAFANAARGREQAGDRERKSAGRIGIRQRRNHAAHVEQNLAARALRQTLPQPPQGVAPHGAPFGEAARCRACGLEATRIVTRPGEVVVTDYDDLVMVAELVSVD